MYVSFLKSTKLFTTAIRYAARIHEIAVQFLHSTVSSCQFGTTNLYTKQNTLKRKKTKQLQYSTLVHSSYLLYYLIKNYTNLAKSVRTVRVSAAAVARRPCAQSYPGLSGSWMPVIPSKPTLYEAEAGLARFRLCSFVMAG